MYPMKTKHWASADHHFGHYNIIKYTNRPFKNENHMDRVMIDNHNEVVRPGDHVYLLGDVTLGIRGFYYLEKLAGKKFIIPGGHDKRWLNFQVPDDVTILPPLFTMALFQRTITMCHYPLASWEKSHYGAHHFHGHCHGTIGVMSPSSDRQLPPGQKVGKRVDVGVDNWDFYPVDIRVLITMLEAETWPKENTRS